MNTQGNSYIFNNLRDQEQEKLHGFFDKIHLSDEAKKYSTYKLTSPVRSLVGRVLMVLWLLEGPLAAFLFQIK